MSCKLSSFLHASYEMLFMFKCRKTRGLDVLLQKEFDTTVHNGIGISVK